MYDSSNCRLVVCLCLFSARRLFRALSFFFGTFFFFATLLRLKNQNNDNNNRKCKMVFQMINQNPKSKIKIQNSTRQYHPFFFLLRKYSTSNRVCSKSCSCCVDTPPSCNVNAASSVAFGKGSKASGARSASGGARSIARYIARDAVQC